MLLLYMQFKGGKLKVKVIAKHQCGNNVYLVTENLYINRDTGATSPYLRMEKCKKEFAESIKLNVEYKGLAFDRFNNVVGVY